MSADKEVLQRQAQALLAQAKKCLKEAGQLAEKGEFELFFEGGHFIPRSAAGGALAQDDMTEEQGEQLETNGIYPNEYQSFGMWWTTSNC